MRVAFQGEAGAYSEQAVYGYFGNVEAVPCESFDSVFEFVSIRKCETGLIPIENSLAGSVHQNYDLLLKNSLHITGEYFLRVRHCLIALPGTQKADVKKALSHPQALGQCAGYLKTHGIRSEAVFDTAGSVKMLKESGAHDTAAIASRQAAEIYGMQILDEDIEDNPENYTRFLSIAIGTVKPQGEAKTSIVFILKNQPGSLFNALRLLAERNIDMTKIESRPLVGKPWEYLFYIDFIGATGDALVDGALDDLDEYALMLRVLGSYSRFKG